MVKTLFFHYVVYTTNYLNIYRVKAFTSCYILSEWLTVNDNNANCPTRRPHYCLPSVDLFCSQL